MSSADLSGFASGRSRSRPGCSRSWRSARPADLRAPRRPTGDELIDGTWAPDQDQRETRATLIAVGRCLCALSHRAELDGTVLHATSGTVLDAATLGSSPGTAHTRRAFLRSDRPGPGSPWSERPHGAAGLVVASALAVLSSTKRHSRTAVSGARESRHHRFRFRRASRRAGAIPRASAANR